MHSQEGISESWFNHSGVCSVVVKLCLQSSFYNESITLTSYTELNLFNLLIFWTIPQDNFVSQYCLCALCASGFRVDVPKSRSVVTWECIAVGGGRDIVASRLPSEPFVCMERRETVEVRVLYLLHSRLEAPEELHSTTTSWITMILLLLMRSHISSSNNLSKSNHPVEICTNKWFFFCINSLHEIPSLCGLVCNYT